MSVKAVFSSLTLILALYLVFTYYAKLSTLAYILEWNFI